eukprot:1146156-Pelagomonas_calceolata.AAC.3
MGIRRITSRSPCLTLAMSADRGLLKSASASKRPLWLYECQDQALQGAPEWEGVDNPAHT